MRLRPCVMASCHVMACHHVKALGHHVMASSHVRSSYHVIMTCHVMMSCPAVTTQFQQAAGSPASRQDHHQGLRSRQLVMSACHVQSSYYVVMSSCSSPCDVFMSCQHIVSCRLIMSARHVMALRHDGHVIGTALEA